MPCIFFFWGGLLTESERNVRILHSNVCCLLGSNANLHWWRKTRSWCEFLEHLWAFIATIYYKDQCNHIWLYQLYILLLRSLFFHDECNPSSPQFPVCFDHSQSFFSPFLPSISVKYVTRCYPRFSWFQHFVWALHSLYRLSSCVMDISSLSDCKYNFLCC